MAWNIDQIYGSLKFIIRKNQAGSFSSTDLFYAWNIEQRMYQSDLLGRFQAKNNGKGGINTGLIENETILTKLAPFTLNATITITAGLGPKPANFMYLLALRINSAPVEYYEHDSRAYIEDSVIDPPSITDNKYYFTEYQNNYQFIPTTVATASIDYIKEVTDVSWSYTLDGDGRQVYDSGTSVQPEWDGNTIIEISKRALVNLGISFKDADFSNFGRIAQTTGD